MHPYPWRGDRPPEQGRSDEKLSQEAQRHGFAEIGNDPHSGVIRYYFDI